MAAPKRNKISPLDLSAAVDGILEQYGEEVDGVISDSIKEVSTKAAQKLHDVREFSEKGHPTGAYSADWTFEFVPSGRFKTTSTIHNADHYQLAHLLEFGHANRNGGRTPGYPHIGKVNTWAEDEVVQEIERRLRQ